MMSARSPWGLAGERRHWRGTVPHRAERSGASTGEKAVHMNRTAGRRALVCLALASVVAIATAVLSYRAIVDLAANVERSARTQALLGAVDRLALDLTAAEAGQRAYVLSGEPRFLDEYRAAADRLARALQD